MGGVNYDGKARRLAQCQRLHHSALICLRRRFGPTHLRQASQRIVLVQSAAVVAHAAGEVVGPLGLHRRRVGRFIDNPLGDRRADLVAVVGAVAAAGVGQQGPAPPIERPFAQPAAGVEPRIHADKPVAQIVERPLLVVSLQAAGGGGEGGVERGSPQLRAPASPSVAATDGDGTSRHGWKGETTCRPHQLPSARRKVMERPYCGGGHGAGRRDHLPSAPTSAAPSGNPRSL